MNWRRLCALAALAFAGCSTSSTPLTEILVVVDTDLAIPSGADTIEIDAIAPSGRAEHASVPLSGAGAYALPISVGLVHRGGPLGPVDVTARALLGAAGVVERRGVVTFLSGRTVVLRLDLRASCMGVVCGADQTCADAVCTSVEVDPGTFGDLDGGTGRLDGGARQIDADTDPLDSGTGPLDGGPGRPDSGATCGAGLGDCDMNAANGCERSLTSVTDCGACDWPCDLANASESCSTGECTLGACATGFGDCNGIATDGCEASLTSLMRCGSCTAAVCTLARATPTCASGTCAVASCDTGWGNCDTMASNGCEQRLNTDAHCNACGVTCTGGTRCMGGACR